jgi:hypothetical protein
MKFLEKWEIILIIALALLAVGFFEIGIINLK